MNAIKNRFENEGLIISNAFYGNFESDFTKFEPNTSNCIDIAIPLQLLDQRNHLVIEDFSNLTQFDGIYDPFPDFDKKLLIKYTFQNRQHAAIFDENESIDIPSEDHLVT